MQLTSVHLDAFASDLLIEEKSPYTREKYIRDVRKFHEYIAGQGNNQGSGACL